MHDPRPADGAAPVVTSADFVKTATMTRRPGARGKLDRALALLGFLADMCAEHPMRAIADDDRSDEQILADLRGDRQPQPLPVRTHGNRDLERLIATGHVERVGVRPSALQLTASKAPTLICNEAVRLTPKGRELCAQLNEASRDPAKVSSVLELLFAAVDFDERTREALRVELGGGLTYGTD